MLAFCSLQLRTRIRASTHPVSYYEHSRPIEELYDMEADPGERHNLYESHPEVFQRLLAQLESDVKRGRSTEGPDQKNDVERINTRRGMKGR